MSRRRPDRAARLGWPIWTRLLAFALVPLGGMALVATPVLRERAAVVDASRRTDRDVAALNAVLELRYVVGAEFIPTETMLRAQAFGLSGEAGSALLGFDLAGELTRTRGEVDAALASWPDHLAYPTRVAELVAEVRQQTGDGSATVNGVHSRYLTIVGEMNQLIDASMGGAVTSTASSAQSAGIDAAIHRLIDAHEIVHAGNDQMEALFRLVVSGDETAADQLATATVLYHLLVDELTAESPPELRAAVTTLATDPDASSVEAGIEALTAPGKRLDLAAMAELFRTSFVRADLARRVAVVAADDATTLARSRAAQARSDLGTLVTNVLVLSLLTVGGALGLAWSITRRLRPLAERGRRISEGDLVGDVADERGPREVTLVARALNDTVANLRHIEAQAATLARGDLDDPVLAEPAPGLLGASIHATVLELSRAWREGDELQQRLAHQANHDLLTSLPNRKAALEALDQALARANRHGDAVWVLFCDLDGFKRANDTFGHHVGDRILRTCAERLAGCVRSGDTVARLGGDEFVVITDRLTTAREAADLARRLIDVVGEPIELEGLSTRVGLSVGIGMSLDGRGNALDLLRDADNAVHRAKKLGKGRYEVFDEQARDELNLHNELEQALALALERDELTLHYQPVTDTVTGAVRGLEALARWTRDGQPVSPADFIPVAEQSDLINDLGRWALRTATHQLAAWAADGRFDDAYVAVNVSGRHLLSTCLVDDVRAALDESGLDPRRLVIEITETVIVSDLVTAIAHLEAVRALGVRVALDDFGTGYTSIGQLWRLPIDVLKIDGSFIRHLETAHDHVIVELMIEVAHTLGLALVAEGVETTTQQATLRDLNCDAIQGYLIARPQPADRVVTPVD